jgi:AraC-like DNA-binding protein
MRLGTDIRSTGGILSLIKPITVSDEYHQDSLLCKKEIGLTDSYLGGNIKTLHTGGLIVIDCDCQSKLSSEIKSDLDINPECIVMDFLFEGKILEKGADGRETAVLNEGYHNLRYLPCCSRCLYFQAYRTLNFFSIFLSKSFYFKLLNPNNKIHQDFAGRIQSNKPGALSDQYLPMNYDMRRIVDEIRHCTRKGCFFRMCLESKIIELLMLQLEQFHYRYVEITPKLPINEEDREKLGKAKTILENEYAPPPTIRQLALMAGTNEYKLKAGFKLLFNSTIHSYALKIRMLKANELIKEQKLQVQEIAEMLGYRNTSHFSSSFKGFFGYLPTEVIQTRIPCKLNYCHYNKQEKKHPLREITAS